LKRWDSRAGLGVVTVAAPGINLYVWAFFTVHSDEFFSLLGLSLILLVGLFDSHTESSLIGKRTKRTS
jgi:hypothetical protein